MYFDRQTTFHQEDDNLFCESSLCEMVSVKTNKNKNLTPLLKTNFSRLETLFLGPERFLHSEGPKNAILLMDQFSKIAISGNPVKKI